MRIPQQKPRLLLSYVVLTALAAVCESSMHRVIAADKPASKGLGATALDPISRCRSSLNSIYIVHKCRGSSELTTQERPLRTKEQQTKIMLGLRLQGLPQSSGKVAALVQGVSGIEEVQEVDNRHAGVRRWTVILIREVRRTQVAGNALVQLLEPIRQVKAANGFLGTPVTEVAKRAKISTAYVFRLFPSKEQLFVAALERTFELVLAALKKGADESEAQTPEALLFAMGGSYAALIADRKLLQMQVHAQSAMHVPEIAKSFRGGLKAVVTYVKDRSDAPDEQVQRFMAYSQLCHLITITGLEGDTSAWSQVLTAGIRHG